MKSFRVFFFDGFEGTKCVDVTAYTKTEASLKAIELMGNCRGIQSKGFKGMETIEL